MVGGGGEKENILVYIFLRILYNNCKELWRCIDEQSNILTGSQKPYHSR